MHIKEFLEKVCNEIKYKPIQNDISEELKNHIEEIKQEQLDNGTTEEEAEEIAVKQMGEPMEIGKKLNKIHRPKFDWKLVILVLILLGFGILVSFIKTENVLVNESGINYIVKNVLFLAIGLILGIGIYFFDSSKLSKYSNYIYLVATIISIFSIYMAPSFINGKIYLRMGMMAVSIERIVMPLYVLAFAGFINNYDKNRIISVSDININLHLVKILVCSFISIYLMFVIPSMISSIMLLIIYLILATLKIIENKETRKKNLFIMYGIIILMLLPIVINVLFLNPYKLNRFTISINPENDPNGGGWSVIQQRKILDSANWIGEADDLGDAMNLIDEGDNLALISIIAHYGWLPAIILIIAVVGVSIKIIYNSKIVKQVYGKYLLIGLGSLFILESVVNVFMNLTIGIQIGSNLPFVSYGGSNLVMNIVSLAVILSVYRRKDI